MADAAGAAEALGEVMRLHAWFAAWLGRGTGAFAALEAALAPDFTMVVPDGRLVDRDAVLAALAAERGTRGAEFAILIEAGASRALAPGCWLVTYRERQPASLRRASAILSREAGGGWRWRHVQESWCQGSA